MGSEKKREQKRTERHRYIDKIIMCWAVEHHDPQPTPKMQNGCVCACTCVPTKKGRLRISSPRRLLNGQISSQSAQKRTHHKYSIRLPIIFNILLNGELDVYSIVEMCGQISAAYNRTTIVGHGLQVRAHREWFFFASFSHRTYVQNGTKAREI